jgi:polyisoprenoid-binding protein YceI
MRSVQPAFQALTVIAALVAAASAQGAELKLDGSNTKIGFVGTKPEGKHEGGFKTITGAISYDATDLTSTEISLNINANSIWSDDEKLTAHLKSPDFFDVRKFKEATFKSTQVTKGDAAGEYKVTGDFTLRGVKKSISFPAKIAMKDGAFTLSSNFTINRSDFGMSYGAGKIDDEVAITAVIGATK